MMRIATKWPNTSPMCSIQFQAWSINDIAVCGPFQSHNMRTHKMSSISSSGDRTKNPDSTINQRPSSVSASATNGDMCTTSSRRRTRQRNRGGSETQFPGKLYDMLDSAEENGFESVVSWIRDGRAFMVHDPEKLVDVLPMFFGQTKYRSFRRQLNMWHFHRILEGPDRGAFTHPCFVRGNKQLCSYMSRHLFANPSAPADTDDRSSDDECRIESPRLRQTLATAFDRRSMDSAPASTDAFTHDNVRSQKLDMFEASSFRLTESPITSASLETLPGISIAGLRDGDPISFGGRRFHFLDSCDSNWISRSDKNRSAVTSFKGYQEMSKNTVSFQLNAFGLDQPMIVSDELLDPIDPETMDSLFSLSPMTASSLKDDW
jgi:HSF-type DNA-binding